MLIDTHCHLANAKLLPQIKQTVEQAITMGVSRVICATATLEESRKAQQIARDFENIFCQAGIHPHHAEQTTDDDLAQIAELMQFEKCVALGEIGLDYHYDYSPRDHQRKAFEAQLDLAKQLNCPVAIHTREAFEDTIAIIRNSGFAGEKIIFHSFTAGPDEAKICLDLGAMLSFSGIATFRSAEKTTLQSAVICPADRMTVETDAPFLSPEPIRQIKINTPGNVKYVAQKIADKKRIDFEEFAQQTTQNACKFFELPDLR